MASHSVQLLAVCARSQWQVLVIFDTGTTGASLTTSSPAAIKEQKIIVSGARLESEAVETVNTKPSTLFQPVELRCYSPVSVSTLRVLTGGVKGRV